MTTQEKTDLFNYVHKMYKEYQGTVTEYGFSTDAAAAYWAALGAVKAVGLWSEYGEWSRGQ